MKMFFSAFNYEKNKFINIQFLSARHFIKYPLISFSQTTKYINDDRLVMFDDRVDIIVDNNSRKIYFRDFTKLQHWHIDFSDLYREATNEEIENFKSHFKDNIKLFNITCNTKDIKVRNRKKIAYALEHNLLNRFTHKDKEIKTYINNYLKNRLEYKDKQFIISNNTQIKDLIDIIFEHYYKGEITNQSLLASSNETITNNKE